MFRSRSYTVKLTLMPCTFVAAFFFSITAHWDHFLLQYNPQYQKQPLKPQDWIPNKIGLWKYIGMIWCSSPVDLIFSYSDLVSEKVGIGL